MLWKMNKVMQKQIFFLDLFWKKGSCKRITITLLTPKQDTFSVKLNSFNQITSNKCLQRWSSVAHNERHPPDTKESPGFGTGFLICHNQSLFLILTFKTHFLSPVMMSYKNWKVGFPSKKATADSETLFGSQVKTQQEFNYSLCMFS